jgi:hypothetical protein
VEGADVGRPVAERRQRHPALTLTLGGPAESAGDGKTGTDDAGGEHQSDVGPDHVHGPALAFSRPLGPSQHFGQQGPQRYPFGDLVMKAAVGGDEIVVLTESGSESGRHRFLAPR